MKDRIKEHAKAVRWSESHICSWCGKEIKRFEDATLDHIVPRSLGGRTRLMNLQLLHDRCNGKKGSTMKYFSTSMMKAFEIVPSRLDENGVPKL